MVHLDLAKWGQNTDLHLIDRHGPYEKATQTYLGLYMIASEQVNAGQWASEIGRTISTVPLGAWV